MFALRRGSCSKPTSGLSKLRFKGLRFHDCAITHIRRSLFVPFPTSLSMEEIPETATWVNYYGSVSTITIRSLRLGIRDNVQRILCSKENGIYFDATGHDAHAGDDVESCDSACGPLCPNVLTWVHGLGAITTNRRLHLFPSWILDGVLTDCSNSDEDDAGCTNAQLTHHESDCDYVPVLGTSPVLR